ncbi:tetrahydroberberine oxidase-like [Andrographis paniculata]|uniref:tetrahydroberberine oxidase-like n=1 Tax=Andrographis paniculata TaxID=175694 RepID=UPI0021E84B6C|nr:tetrahydroberberine oxidase-like [Andrographis paniculata]
MLSRTPLVPLLVLLIFSYSCSVIALVHQDFLDCLSLSDEDTNDISSVLYTPINSSYSTILVDSIRNTRFATPTAPKPLLIVTPVRESQVPPIILCAKQSGLQIRTRSGGHDYEGLSYLSRIPFMILDLFRLNDIDIDLTTRTAWVQTGATNGQLYNTLYNTDPTLGFPAGGCPTVGVGGLFAGGGYGGMFRKYGLAADNIIDARIVDVNGRILDKVSMGEDLFWAIRGGGGASFGVILAWRVQLVTMPDLVTIFAVTRTLEQNLTDILDRWQYVAPNLTKDIYIGVFVAPVFTTNVSLTLQGSFGSLYLGRKSDLLKIMDNDFPELGVTAEDCQEVRWIQSSLVFGGYTIDANPDILLSRNPTIPSSIRATRFSYKAKLDYVHKPIPKRAFKGLWKLMLERQPDQGELLFAHYGGKMNEISESATPFPHRNGTLFKIQQLSYWNHTGNSRQSIRWVRRVNRYLTPYVTKNPRLSYMNYRDLDLGINNVGNTSYRQASSWGLKYFKGNFRRLAEVKTVVDPTNYFRHEQSVPLLKDKIQETSFTSQVEVSSM